MLNAKEIFGVGNTYTNIILGINPLEEVAKKVEELFKKGIISYNTIYHSSGLNQIGEIKMNIMDIYKYHRWYSSTFKRYFKKKSVIFDRRSIPNHLFNDYVEIEEYKVKPLMLHKFNS